MPARRTENLGNLSEEQSNIARKVFSRGDANKFAEWTKASTIRVDMVEALNLFSQDREKGTPRLLVLVDACANFYYRQKFEIDETLTTRQRKEIAGQVLHALAEDQVRVAGEDVKDEEKITEAMRKIFMEGFDDEGKLTSPGEVTTVLSGKIEELVEPWVKKDSPQAQLKRAEFSLASERETLGQTKDLLARQRELNQNAVSQTEEAKKQLAEARDLARRFYLERESAGKETWDNAAREKAGKVYEALPTEIKEYIETYIVDSDWIQPIGIEVDEPENLAEKDRELLKKLRELDGFATRVLKELVFRETGYKELAFLPDILHLKLEERRIEQVKARERNRQIKDLRAHEPRIEITDGGMVIDESWKVISGKAKDLAVPLLSQDVKLGLTTGLEDITNVEMLIDTDGKIKQTEIISCTLTKNPDKDVVRSRLIILTADENQTGPIKLVKPKTQRENKFSIQTGEQRIGDVEIGKDGKLLIKWIDMELAAALDANVKLVNLLEHHLYGGEEGLKGLKLTMVRKIKAGVEVPAEKPKDEVKEPAAAAEEQLAEPVPAPAAGTEEEEPKTRRTLKL